MRHRWMLLLGSPFLGSFFGSVVSCNGNSDLMFFQFLAGPLASLVASLVPGITRKSKEAILTSDRVFRWLTLSRSASPILPTAPVPDPRLSHAELAPSKFVSPRSPWRSCFFGQRFPPVRDAAAENECAGPGVPP